MVWTRVFALGDGCPDNLWLCSRFSVPSSRVEGNLECVTAPACPHPSPPTSCTQEERVEAIQSRFEEKLARSTELRQQHLAGIVQVGGRSVSRSRYRSCRAEAGAQYGPVSAITATQRAGGETICVRNWIYRI